VYFEMTFDRNQYMREYNKRPGNREKHRALVRKYYQSSRGKEVKRAWQLQQYGLTEDQYHAMYEAQNECCKICGDVMLPERVHVDHSHQTNKVRGLLCLGCNTGIGSFAERPDALRAAAAYLERT
jgi:hypothetical protein